MNALSQYVRDEDIVLDADVADRDALFARAAQLLAVHTGIAERDIVRELLRRESLGSTAMGHGIAIPHARMAHLREPAFAFVRTRRPIPFHAPDGRPVSQFLFLLVPMEANEKHLRLMAAAAGALSDDAVRTTLGGCSRQEEARESLGGWEERPG
jgi:PTS system nitrogen regulatory IIA component